MANYEEQMKALQKPLNPNRVVWRVQQMGWSNNKPWVMVLAYLDNRAVQERFDEVFGIAGWKNEYKTGPDGGILCGISVKFGDEWVTKWDGADKTQVEAVKGGLSGSMKRAAVQWGVGRYLYDLSAMFAKTSSEKVEGWNKGYDKSKNKSYWWETPQLPQWALPKNDVKQEKANIDPMLVQKIKDSQSEIALQQLWNGIPESEKDNYNQEVNKRLAELRSQK